MNYGYIRVSTKDQNIDRQIDTLIKYGISTENIYIDHITGSTFKRPAYQQLLSIAQRGDLIVITSVDRLGRNYTEIQEQWRYITKVKEVDIKVLDMPLLDTTYCKDILHTFIADLVLQILSFQAEQERLNIKQRQAEGIAAARLRGTHLGRPRKPLPENFMDLYRRRKSGESMRKLALEAKISPTTLRKRFAEYESDLASAAPQDEEV